MGASYLRPRIESPKAPAVGSREWLILRESWVLPLVVIAVVYALWLVAR